MKRKIIKANLGTAIPGVEEMLAGATLGEFDQNYFNRQQKIAEYNLNSKKQAQLKNMDKFSAIGNAAQMFSSFLPKQEETALQQGINNGAKQIGNVIGAVGGPIGQAVNAAIQIGDAVGQGLHSLGIGTTDNMTIQDQILGSNLMAFSPLAWVNSGFGKRAKAFSKDTELAEDVGSDYGGSMSLLDNAMSKQGKKYGLFSSRSRRKANNQINKAINAQNLLTDIRDDSEWRKIVARNTSQLHNTSYNTALNGGLQLARGYQKGGSLDNKLSKVKGRNYKKVTLKEPPTWEPIISLEIPDRSIEELIVEAKNQNPRFIQRMSEPVRYIKINKKDAQGNDYWESATHLMSNRDNKVYSLVQEIDGKLQLLNDDEAFDRANSAGNILTFKTNSEARTFAEDNYKIGWPEFFNSPVEQGEMESEINMFKDGGKLGKEEEIEEQKNVIPEGALHKNKHHMEDAEGLTKKGIPVVDNEGEQQAEIEKEEIVFTLEVTKQLEDFLQQFNNEESKSKQDEIAIEAGKLLVEQILYNTDDKANLIERVE